MDSFNYEAVKSILLDPLGPGGTREFASQVFDHRTDSEVAAPTQRAGEADILLFDGVFLQRPELKDYWDFVIWVDAPFDITVPRAVARDAVRPEDATVVQHRYDERYVPGQLLYIRQCDPIGHADVVVRNEDVSNPRLEVPKPSKAM